MKAHFVNIRGAKRTSQIDIKRGEVLTTLCGKSIEVSDVLFAYNSEDLCKECEQKKNEETIILLLKGKILE